MHRGVAYLAFVIGFVAVMVLGGGLQSPAASQLEQRENTSWIAPEQWHITTERYPRAPEDPPHTSFGTLMPDGTYCGVGCPSWDTQD